MKWNERGREKAGSNKQNFFSYFLPFFARLACGINETKEEGGLVLSYH